jgi:hypothetical protein
MATRESLLVDGYAWEAWIGANSGVWSVAVSDDAASHPGVDR